jgi:hypothetical protein
MPNIRFNQIPFNVIAVKACPYESQEDLGLFNVVSVVPSVGNGMRMSSVEGSLFPSFQIISPLWLVLLHLINHIHNFHSLSDARIPLVL